MYLDELKTNIGDPLSDEGYELLCEEAREQIASGYIADQMDLVNYISQLLVDKATQLSTPNTKRYDELQKYWAFLAFAAFIGYTPADKSNLLQRRILFALQKGLDPQSILNQFYSTFESDEFISDMFKVFARDLEQNTENFGTMPITIEGKRMLPQLKYWIMDYSKFPSKVAKRGTVERLNYVNNSANAKALTQGQREILLAVLKLYDEFLNPNIPHKNSAATFENELADTYSAAAQIPTNTSVPVPAPTPPMRVPVSSPIPTQVKVVAPPVLQVASPNEELIMQKLQDLRQRNTIDGEKK